MIDNFGFNLIHWPTPMKIHDIRNDGKYLDLWSVNHFLSGVVYAGWMFKWGFKGWLFFAIYFVLAVAWELYESYADIFEEFGNKVMDVVTGVIGYFLVLYLSPSLLIIEVATVVYIATLIISYEASTSTVLTSSTP